MYKLLLCWRYLRTRYLALACIISVMLGVATLIVVNSVMGGFSNKLRERLHALLSDIVIEAAGMEGFAGAEEKMARIARHPKLKDKIAAMAPTMEVFAIIEFSWPNGEPFTRPVRLIGVDAKTRSQVGGFQEHLFGPGMCEEVNERGQKEWRPKSGLRKERDFELSPVMRQYYTSRHRFLMEKPAEVFPVAPDQPPPPVEPERQIKIPRGVIIGNLIACIRQSKIKPEDAARDSYLLIPGDEVKLITLSGPLTRAQGFGERAERKMMPVYDTFVVVDYFKSEMSEYDNNYVFVPLDYLQHIRTMHDRVTSIQIKLKDYADAKDVVEELRRMFPLGTLRVETWEDKQGPLLQAIAIEKGILNVLLFLIIAVAGFGILAIFSMIVTEKTRDIGILKALGASNGGVLKIFLGYGLLLGIVGAGLGTLLGVSLTLNINEVEQFLSRMTGQEIFDRKVYYFDSIPTQIQALSLILVNAGAVAIAVLFSILPALRAAMLHPVKALRFE